MQCHWLRVIVSFLCAFLFVEALNLIVGLFAVFEYPPPSEGSWQAISSAFGLKLNSFLTWSAPVFHWLFPPMRGQKFTPQEFFGPLITNVVLATALFYTGFTWWVRRLSRVRRKA